MILERRYADGIVVYETMMSSTIPLYTTAEINLAWLYLQVGREDDALELMGRLLEDTPDPLYVLTHRSQLYALALRYDEAIADMDAAIAMKPNDPALYVERGQRILLLYQWDRALADYNHALELDPDYADAYYYRGILYASVPEGINARRNALADFRHYLELTPAGDHAEDAARYISEIQAQFDALATTTP